jgi:hypothetical protein
MGDTSSEAQRTPRVWWTLGIALSACVLSAGLATLVTWLLDLRSMDAVYRSAAWCLTPWRAFPSIIDEHVPVQSLSPAWSGVGDCVTIILGQGVGLLLLHSLVFLTVALVYAKCGWPAYWSDVRGRLCLGRLWARSAILACWAFPLSGALWSIWMKIADAQQWTAYWLVTTGGREFIANLAAVLLGHALVIAAVLRHSVVRSVGCDDLRCRCGYLLRGLTEPRCPECARAIPSGKKPYFGLRWFGSPVWKPLRWGAPPVVLLGLLLAPVWVGAVLAAVPKAIQRGLPRSLQATCRRLSTNPNAFPVRWNALLLVRRDGALGAVRFSSDPQMQWQYKSAFWSSEGHASRLLPDTTTVGSLAPPGIIPISIGPWTFSYSAGSSKFAWVYRADRSYEVEVVGADKCTIELAWPNSDGKVDLPP